MARLSKVYQELWDLAGNPFPDHAIAASGDDQPFYSALHPGTESKMARAFIGSNGAVPKVGFFWSVGEGEQARGYGKTRYLLWFAEQINADHGRKLSLVAGNAHPKSIMAAYAAFNSLEPSLSNLAFDVARDIVGARSELVTRLRMDSLASRSSESLRTAAQQLLIKSDAPWSPALLSRLCHGEPSEWAEFLGDTWQFSAWHRVRIGREILRTCVAFLRVLGVTRFVVLVDQVEDFANYSTPYYKLRRDFPRLASLCTDDGVIGGHTTFVLTMHPRAARVLHRYWPNADLGPISQNANFTNVVCLGPITAQKLMTLAGMYLNAVRLNGAEPQPKPFTESAISSVCQLEEGRPGYCLQRLFFLLEYAANRRTKVIDSDLVRQSLSELDIPVEH